MFRTSITGNPVQIKYRINSLVKTSRWFGEQSLVFCACADRRPYVLKHDDDGDGDDHDDDDDDTHCLNEMCFVL